MHMQYIYNVNVKVCNVISIQYMGYISIGLGRKIKSRGRTKKAGG
jgi:hypothetical protein